jgi:hypothetical protein
MGESVVYAGRDLEAMIFARRYHSWILDTFSHYLGTRIVEVGAGNGSFSELLINRLPESLDLVEPSSQMFRLLEQRFGKTNSKVQVHTHNCMFGQVAFDLRTRRRPDSILYVNVLEHIEDDCAELSTVFNTLDVGGRLFVFVPAFEALLGPFDKQVGHLRRYRMGDLAGKARKAGFTVVESRYFDFFGVVPWWLKYRVLKSEGLEPGVVKFYDRFVVPVAQRVERIVKPPFGKNLLLIAEKKSSA